MNLELRGDIYLRVMGAFRYDQLQEEVQVFWELFLQLQKREARNSTLSILWSLHAIQKLQYQMDPQSRSEGASYAKI